MGPAGEEGSPVTAIPELQTNLQAHIKLGFKRKGQTERNTRLVQHALHRISCHLLSLMWIV